MDQKFSKSDIINVVAEKTGQPKRAVKAIVDATFEEISNIMFEGGSVTVQGFGRLYTKTAQPRSFKKINSEDTVTVGERTLPKMKFSKNFTARVKGE